MGDVSEKVFNVVCLGTSAVDMIVEGATEMPNVSERKIVDEAKLRIGGSAINTAITLKKLGTNRLNVTCVAPFGHGLLGKFVRQKLEHSGVKPAYSKKYCSKYFHTPVSIVLLNETKEPRYLHAPYGNSAMALKHIKEECVTEAIKKADWLHLGGFGLLSSLEGRDKNTSSKFEKWLLSRLKENKNLRISVDICKVQNGCKSVWEENIGSWIKHVHYFWPNLCESLQMLNNGQAPDSLTESQLGPSYGQEGYWIHPKDGCVQIREQYFGHKKVCVAITCAQNGVYVLREETDEAVASQAYKSKNVKSANGAGDAWCGGFIYSTLVLNKKPLEAADFANATALSCVNGFGAVSGIPAANVVQSVVEMKPSRISIELPQ